jgi:hypothetical protein
MSKQLNPSYRAAQTPRVTSEAIEKTKKVSNPDIICHYEYADYRLIVKRKGAASPYLYNLHVEKKTRTVMDEEVWMPCITTNISEPEDIYSFGRLVDSGNGVLDLMTTLASILLYKRQDLLVDKMEAK